MRTHQSHSIVVVVYYLPSIRTGSWDAALSHVSPGALISSSLTPFHDNLLSSMKPSPITVTSTLPFGCCTHHAALVQPVQTSHATPQPSEAIYPTQQRPSCVAETPYRAPAAHCNLTIRNQQQSQNHPHMHLLHPLPDRSPAGGGGTRPWRLPS
ncbi:hypothetical protein LIA77_06591 [Sarocladium implicatum]|nr:hypothetical protein LIA77_06591 [Sarocladium implicatum]